MIRRIVGLKKFILTFVMMIMLFIPIAVSLEYTGYFNTFNMKISTPSGVSADIKWESDSGDENDSYSGGGSAALTGQNVALASDFYMFKFDQDQPRDSTTQNLIDLWQRYGEDDSIITKITPTISKLKNGDYIVSGLYNNDPSRMVKIIRTFDFNQDGQLDCYFVFTGYRTEELNQYLLNYIASSAGVTPYSVANWNPYMD